KECYGSLCPESISVLSPGFTPVGFESEFNNVQDNGDINGAPDKILSPLADDKIMNSSQVVQEEPLSGSSGHNVGTNGGAVLGVLEEVICVGQAMGYSMEGCEKGVEAIIGNHGDDVVLDESFIHQHDLERGLTRDEIRTAVWSCGDNKSPGPDGYSFEFFTKVVDAGIFKGVRLSNSLSLPHFFYADDALIIGEWFNDNQRSIINTLRCFHLASGYINIHKSQLLGVGVPQVDVETAASSIGCSIMNDQFHYLGVTVGENMSRHKAWADVILKLRSRLSKSKLKTLSIGGRITL
nr:RNA-directed DNA polymerase, eukaryota, reverse transcriptase zinc-binding domain protein [Tanacetum cinerariifolium]